MAAGAGTWGTTSYDVTSVQRMGSVTLTGTSSYPTGGYLLKPSQFGLNAISNIIATPYDPAGTATTCYVGLWDTKNGALRFMKGQAGLLLEESNGTNVSAFQFTITAFGT